MNKTKQLTREEAIQFFNEQDKKNVQDMRIKFNNYSDEQLFRELPDGIYKATFSFILDEIKLRFDQYYTHYKHTYGDECGICKETDDNYNE